MCHCGSHYDLYSSTEVLIPRHEITLLYRCWIFFSCQPSTSGFMLSLFSDAKFTSFTVHLASAFISTLFSAASLATFTAYLASTFISALSSAVSPATFMVYLASAFFSDSFLDVMYIFLTRFQHRITCQFYSRCWFVLGTSHTILTILFSARHIPSGVILNKYIIYNSRNSFILLNNFCANSNNQSAWKNLLTTIRDFSIRLQIKANLTYIYPLRNNL